jgi:S1-C subfamily serine protease
VVPPSTTSGFAADYAREQSGVVRIMEATCDGDFTGSGFLVGPNLVVTAAHVVNGETTLTVVDPVSGTTIPAQVVGVDTATDVALVRTQTAMTGYVFSFATADPQVGSTIAAIGYPLNGPESIDQGLVSGLDRTIPIDNGQTLSGMIQTDASLNPGNSGGPMIGQDGKVEGIADAGATDAQGINYAVAATRAAPLVGNWRQHPVAVAPAACTAPAPVPSPTPVPTPTATATGTAPVGAEAAAEAVVAQYVSLINAQNFSQAYALLTPAGQQRAGSEAQWAQGLAGSVYTGVQVVGAHTLAGGGVDVELTFTSNQPGQSCKNWDLDYQLLPNSSGGYLIDIAQPHDGGSGSTPC